MRVARGDFEQLHYFCYRCGLLWIVKQKFPWIPQEFSRELIHRLRNNSLNWCFQRSYSINGSERQLLSFPNPPCLNVDRSCFYRFFDACKTDDEKRRQPRPVFTWLKSDIERWFAHPSSGFLPTRLEPIDNIIAGPLRHFLLSTIAVDKFVDKLWTRQVSRPTVTIFSFLAVFWTFPKFL